MPFNLPTAEPVHSPMGGKRHRVLGFTLLEILLAVSLLAVLLVITASVIGDSSRVLRQANSKIESFQAARAAFELITSRVSQATLNTYWDYYDSSNTAYTDLAPSATSGFVPARYGRNSDLHFVCGNASGWIQPPPDYTLVSGHAVFFAAPTGSTAQNQYAGLSGLLSACGYFVSYGSDRGMRPDFLNTQEKLRWRLMELAQPAESLRIFNASAGNGWFLDTVTDGQVRAVADNVIALVIWPRLAVQDDPDGKALTTDYRYDSRTSGAWSGTPPRQPVQAHQLPPSLQITMVAIDEESAARMEKNSSGLPLVQAALAGLFVNVEDHAEDLETLQERLNESRIIHRLFSSTITMKEAKWSP